MYVCMYISISKLKKLVEYANFFFINSLKIYLNYLKIHLNLKFYFSILKFLNLNSKKLFDLKIEN